MSARRGPAAAPGPASARRGGLAAAAAVAALLAAFWAVFLPQAERSVFGRVPLLDEAYYLDRAAAAPDPAEPHYMSPLYPRLIDLTGAATPAGQSRVLPAGRLRGLRALQIACWLGIVALLRWQAGRRLAPLVAPGWRRELVAWLPALLFALYRPGAVYAVSVLVDVPLAFLMTAFLVLATELALPKDAPATSRRTPAWTRLALPAALGVVIGLAGLLRGSALALLPLGLASAAWPARPRRRAVGAAVAVALGAAVALAPAVIHNSRAAGRPVGPALNGGVNLYIGNGPEANGFYVAVVPGSWLLDPAGREFLAGRFDLPAVSLAQADSLWLDAAMASIREKPLRAGGLWLRKLWLHMQGWEIDQLTTLDGWTRSAPALRALPVPYALLSVAGLVGLAAARRSSAGRWWAATFLVLLFVQSAFFVVSRYRLSLVPALALLAGLAVARLLSEGAFSGRRPRAWLLAALPAALLAVPWGLGDVRRDWRAMAAANEALRWAETGRAERNDAALARAEALYRRALEGPTASPAPWLGLAMVLHERGDAAGAEQVLLRGLEPVTQDLDLHKQIIRLQLDGGRRDDAFPRVLAALREHPRDRDLLHWAAVLHEQAGQREPALAAAQALRRHHPDDPQAYVDLGVLLARAGDLPGAAAVFAEGLRRAPGHADLAANLAKAREDLEREDLARKDQAR